MAVMRSDIKFFYLFILHIFKLCETAFYIECQQQFIVNFWSKTLADHSNQISNVANLNFNLTQFKVFSFFSIKFNIWEAPFLIERLLRAF